MSPAIRSQLTWQQEMEQGMIQKLLALFNYTPLTSPGLTLEMKVPSGL
jgi:hypothetical protein